MNCTNDNGCEDMFNFVSQKCGFTERMVVEYYALGFFGLRKLNTEILMSRTKEMNIESARRLAREKYPRLYKVDHADIVMLNADTKEEIR